MTVLRLRNMMIAIMIAAFGVIIALSGPANTIATYSTSSSATVTITGFSAILGPVSKPLTLVIEGTSEPSVSESGTTISGTGTATITASTLVVSGTHLAMITGDSVTNTAITSGGATLSGGQSASDQVTNGEIFFANAGIEDITYHVGY